MGRRLSTLPLLLCLALSLPEAAQTAALTPVCPKASVDQVVGSLVRRNLERAQAMRAYRSTRTYRVDYRGFPGSRSAEMVVDVTFEPPGKKVFVVRSQTGSKLIISHVFKKLLESEQEASDAEGQKSTALNHDNYLFELLGCERLGDSLNYVLAVEPKVKSKFLYRGKIWVDATDYAVSRIAAEPAKNPSFWIKQTLIEQVYGKVREFWLPASNHSATSVRLGGHADFTIEYGGYEMAAAPHQATVAQQGVAQQQQAFSPKP